MRVTIYKCDECKKVLSTGPEGIPHLSIDFNRQSGWVKKETMWNHLKKVIGIRQFCNGNCLGKYFNKLYV